MGGSRSIEGYGGSWFLLCKTAKPRSVQGGASIYIYGSTGVSAPLHFHQFSVFITEALVQSARKRRKHRKRNPFMQKCRKVAGEGFPCAPVRAGAGPERQETQKTQKTQRFHAKMQKKCWSRIPFCSCERWLRPSRPQNAENAQNATLSCKNAGKWLVCVSCAPVSAGAGPERQKTQKTQKTQPFHAKMRKNNRWVLPRLLPATAQPLPENTPGNTQRLFFCIFA